MTRLIVIWMAVVFGLASGVSGQETLAPPSDVTIADHPLDTGKKLDVRWTASADDVENGRVFGYNIYRSQTPTEIAKARKDTIDKAIAAAVKSVTDAFRRRIDPDVDVTISLKVDELTLTQREALRLERIEATTIARTAAERAAQASDSDLPPFIFMDRVDAEQEATYEFTIDNLKRTVTVGEGETKQTSPAEYFARVEAITADGQRSEHITSTASAVPVLQYWSGERSYLSLIVLIFCGAVIFWIIRARRGHPVNVRTIGGLAAIDEAVGRATEMGRSILYVPGIQDMNDIQTIAGITVLSRVARMSAEYDAKIEVPTARSLVMTACRETVQASYLEAGRPDAYNQDLIHYVTNEQFGYVAYLSGMMVREKPAACFYMGAFFAESLILAETGNSIGAIQVAGTAQPAQLPFFVAACDYTLIGEEFFAASAYLTQSPEELGSLKGQDIGKIVVAIILLVGVAMATMAEFGGSESMADAVAYLKNTILK